MEIISEKPITNAYALELLKKRVTEGDEKTIQSITIDYLEKTKKKISGEKAEELVEELVKEVGITRLTAVVIANIMPRTLDELRSILTIEPKDLTHEEMEKILNIVKNYSE